MCGFGYESGGLITANHTCDAIHRLKPRFTITVQKIFFSPLSLSVKLHPGGNTDWRDHIEKDFLEKKNKMSYFSEVSTAHRIFNDFPMNVVEKLFDLHFMQFVEGIGLRNQTWKLSMKFYDFISCGNFCQFVQRMISMIS